MIDVDTKCKLCGHNFSHKYNLKRHLEQNLCKKKNELNLYDIYLRFSGQDKITKIQETQTGNIKYNEIAIQVNTTPVIKSKSIGIQTNNQEIKIKNANTQTQMQLLHRHKETKSIATQTKFDDININNELYPIEKVKYDFIKFKDISYCIEKYKYDTKLMYISKILELVFCNIKYKENHIIKYTKTYPPTFVFLSNKLQNSSNDSNDSNESKYLNIGNGDSIVEYFYPYINKILSKIYENIIKDCKKNHNWDDFYEYNEDNIKHFMFDLKNDNIIKNSIKYFLKNVVVNHKTLKYKI